jgi:hypothetical protein
MTTGAFAADRNHLRDARNREQLWLHHEIRDLTHFHGRRLLACHRDQHYLAHY